MDGEQLYQCAHEVAQGLPGSGLEQPFGPRWDVYKVRGKIFALLTSSTGPQMLNVKVDPPDGVALRRQYPFIAPGYHMSKRHWVTVTPGEGLETALVEELVTTSYLLVVEGLPRAVRPVDPQRYAVAAGLAG
ncbi:MmcQ/YjbR family DNA-binding protein [Actinomyces weissii]|uniref:MmcQ/YjbR family DNA-binding protein n=1 Tax=Actinomyces weissii TaxID=675090 RepID=UPI001F1DC920|nr:MmcQ/YjbR family DNA-binding protein [Actinomyces weissii]